MLQRFDNWIIDKINSDQKIDIRIQGNRKLNVQCRAVVLEIIHYSDGMCVMEE